MFAQPNSVAVAQFERGDDSGWLHFVSATQFAGEPASALRIRSREMPAALQPGRLYLVGYNDLHRHALHGTTYREAGNFRLVSLPLLGEAFFPYEPHLDRLLRDYRDDRVLQTDILIRALRRGQPRTVQLAALQLKLSPSVTMAMRPTHLRRVRSVIRSDARADVQQLLVGAVADLPENRRPRWLASQCRQIIDASGPQLDLGSYRPLLVIRCVNVLAIDGRSRDLPRLQALLLSNAPGVGKAAFDALAALKYEAARDIATTWQNNESIHDEVRRYLTNALR